MAETQFTFASDSVTEGHPDKLCDKVSDAILDACLAQDVDSHVSIDACTKASMVMILGDVITKATVNYEKVIRETVKSVGYDSDAKGMDWRTMNVIVALNEQSPDIAQAMLSSGSAEAESGEGGVVFGYATDESPEMMPMSHLLSTSLCAELDKARKDGKLPWAQPSARAQVVVEYRALAGGAVAPSRIHTVVIDSSRSADAQPDQIEKDLREHVLKVLPSNLLDDKTIYQLQPTRSAQAADTGMAGRKLAVDTYGGWGSHGGGSASGKDAGKVNRSAAYGARWAAKSLVAAKLCKRCVVQLSYSPGSGRPVAVHVDSYGSAAGKTDTQLRELLENNFDFNIGALRKALAMKELGFERLAAYGHFGRKDLELPWEQPKTLS